MASKRQKFGASNKSNTYTTKWVKNALKSMGMGYTEAIKDIAPNLYDTVALGRDVTQRVISPLRSNKAGLERIRGNLNNNKYVQAAQKAYRNAMTDIKSGNIMGDYNREMSLGNSESESGFSFGEESTVSSAASMTEKSTGAAVMTLGDQMKNNTLAQIKMQKASMDATIAMNAASMQQIGSIGTELVNQLTNVNSQLAAIVQYQNENMTKFIEASIGYYDKTGAAITKQNEEDKINASSVFNKRGQIKIDDYKKLVKEQFKNMAKDTQLGAMVSMLTSDGMLDMLASNPLAYATKAMSSYMIPKIMATSIQGMEESYNKFLPTLLTEISDMAEDEAPGFAGMLRRAIGNTFGIKIKGEKKFKDAKVERGAIQFDGETKHAITEIITKELRDQTAYLKVMAEAWDDDAEKKANSKKEYWSYQQNKYVNNTDIDQYLAQQFADNIGSAMMDSKFGQALLQLSNERVSGNKDQEDAVINAIKELGFELSRTDAKNVNTDNLITTIDSLTGANTETQKLLKDAIAQMSEEQKSIYDSMRSMQIQLKNARNATQESIDNDQTGYNLRNSSYYTSRYKEDIKNTDGSIKHKKGDIREIDEVTHDLLYSKRNNTRINDKGRTHIDNGAEEDAKNVLTTITASLNSVTEGILSGKSATDIVKSVGDIIGNQAVILGGKLKTALFGEKDDDGVYKNGMLTNVSNYFKDSASSLKYFITGEAYTDSKGNTHEKNDNSVFANLKNIGNVVKDGVMEKLFGKTKGEDGSYEKTKEGLFGTVTDTFKKGWNGWIDTFFGKEGDTDEERENTRNQVNQYIKDNAPKAATGGIIGAVGGSMMGSSLLGMMVGGPIFGAALGASAGFLAKSEKFQEIMFGKEDSNGERMGGVFSKATQDWFKKNKNFAIGSATVGAVSGAVTGGGLLGTIVGGPIAGALMGTATGIVFKSNMFQNFLFGEEGADGKRKGGAIKRITDAFNKFNKDSNKDNTGLGMTALSTGAGALTGAIVSKMGILGASLSPLGPIGGAIVGLSLGIKSQSKNIKEWLFGKEEGFKGRNGKTYKTQGVIGRIGNSIDVNFIKPMKTQVASFWKNFNFTLKHDVLTPFTLAGEVIAEKAGEIVNDIKTSTTTMLSRLGEGLKTVLLGTPDANRQRSGGILSPLVNGISTAMNTVTGAVSKMVTSTIALPGRLLRTGMELASSKVSEVFHKITAPISTLFKDIRGLVATGIKNVFSLAFKGIGSVLKIASAPFRFLGGLVKAGATSIGGAIKRRAVTKLGDKADKIRDAWANSAAPEGSLRKRVRDRLTVMRSEREEDKLAMELDIKQMKKDEENAKLINRLTKGNFTSDSEGAREYIAKYKPKEYEKLFGKYHARNTVESVDDVDEEHMTADQRKNGISAIRLTNDGFTKLKDPSKLDAKSRVLWYLNAILGDTKKITDNTAEAAGNDNGHEENGYEHNEKSKAAAKVEKEKRATLLNASRANSKAMGIKEYLKDQGNKLKNFFVGGMSKDEVEGMTDEEKAEYKAQNGNLFERAVAPFVSAGKDIGNSLIHNTALGRVFAAKNQVRQQNEESGEGGHGPQIIYHKSLGGRGLLSTIAKGATSLVGSAASSLFGNSDDNSSNSLDSDSSNSGNSSGGIISSLKKALGNMGSSTSGALSSLFAEGKEGDSDGDDISDADEAEEKREDSARLASATSRRRRRRRAKGRKAIANSANEAGADVSDEHADRAEDKMSIANANAKSAKELKKERDEEKYREEQLKLSKATALNTAAGSQASGSTNSMLSKLFSKDGLKIAGIAGIAAFLTNKFPEITEALSNVVSTIGSNMSWGQENQTGKNRESSTDTANRIVSNLIGKGKDTDGDGKTEWNPLQLNEDGSISNMSTPMLKALTTHTVGKKKGILAKGANAIDKTATKYLTKTKTGKNLTIKALMKQGMSEEEAANFIKEYSKNLKESGTLKGKAKNIWNNAKSSGKNVKSLTNLKSGIKEAGLDSSKYKKISNMYESMIKNGYTPAMAKDAIGSSYGSKVANLVSENVGTKSSKLVKNASSIKTFVKNPIKNSKEGLKKAGTKIAEKGKNFIDDAGKKIGKTFGKEISETVAETSAKNVTKAAEKGIGGKILGFIKSGFNTILKKFMSKAGKEASESAAKKVFQNLTKKITEFLPKVAEKLFPKATALLSGKLATVAATAGIGELVFIGVGALDGATAAAKFFQVRKSDLDAKMIAIGTVIGAIAGSTAGSIMDLAFAVIDAVAHTSIWNAIATSLYNLWSGSDSKDAKKLKTAQKKFKSDYTSYQNKQIKKAWETQKKAGIIPKDMTYETFEQGVKDGTYKVTQKSFEDYNTQENGGLMDKATNAVTKGATWVGNNAKKIFGTTYTYEDKKNGVTYKQTSNGEWHAYDKKGNDLGEINKDAIPSSAKKVEHKGKLKAVGDIGKKVAKTAWDNSLIGQGVTFFKNVKKKGVAGAAKAAWDNTIAGKTANKVASTIANAPKNIAKTWDWLNKTTAYYYTSKGDYYDGKGQHYSATGDKMDKISKEKLSELIVSGQVTKQTKTGLQKTAGETFNKIKNGLSSAWKTAGKVASSAFKTVGKGISKVFNTVKNAPGAVIKGVKGAYDWLTKGKSYYYTSKGDYYDGKGQHYSATGDKMDKISKEKLSELIVSGQVTKQTKTGLQKTAGETFNKIKNGLSSAWKTAGKVAKKGINAVKGFRSKLWNGIKDAGGSISKWINNVADKINVGTTKKTGWFTTSGDYYVQESNKTWTHYNSNGDELKKGISDDEISPLCESGVLKSADVEVDTTAKDALDTVRNKIKDAWNTAKDTVSDAWDSFTSWITGGSGNGNTSMKARLKNVYDTNSFTKQKISMGGSGIFMPPSFGGRGNETYFSQNDPRWSKTKYGNDGATMGDSGCGPAALATAININEARGGHGTNPIQMANLAQATGQRDETGTNSNFMSIGPAMMGIDSKQAIRPSAEYIDNEIDSGHPVVLLGKDGGNGSSSAYTKAGHYIVATGRDSNGNIQISDPRGRSYSKKYNAQELASQTSSSWTIGGEGYGPKKKILGGRGSINTKGKNWLDIVAKAKSSIGKQKKGYSQTGYIDVTVDGKKLNTRRDCSGFVSVCLSFYTGKKILTASAGIASGSYEAKYLKAAGFTKMKWPGWNKVKAGDIFVTGGSHTEICAKDASHIVYNCGSNSSCNNPGTTNSGHSSYSYIWRPGEPGSVGSDMTSSESTTDSSTTSTSTSDSSTGTSIFDKLSSGFSNVFTEVSNRLLTGNTSTDFTGVWNGDDSSDSSTSSTDSTSYSSTDGSYTASATGTKAAKAIFKYFTGQGYSPAAIAGILGNGQQESGLNPEAGKNSGPAHGVWQMESGRFEALKKYAKKIGKPWTDLQPQMEYLASELPNGNIAYFGKTATYGSNVGHGAAGKTNWQVAGAKKASYKEFKNSTDPEMAARQFEAAVERASWPRMENRVKYAKEWYNKYKDGTLGGKGTGITTRNFNVDGGRGSKVKTTVKKAKSSYKNTNYKYYMGRINTKTSTEDLLYAAVKILAHIAANTKSIDLGLDELSGYSNTIASNSELSVDYAKQSLDNEKAQYNYIITNDNKSKNKNTSYKSNRNDKVAIEIAKGGY